MEREKVSQGIDFPLRQHRLGPQSEPQTPIENGTADRWDAVAQKFIQDNPNWNCSETTYVHSLTKLFDQNSMSVLCLRGENAKRFLDVLAEVCASRT